MLRSALPKLSSTATAVVAAASVHKNQEVLNDFQPSLADGGIPVREVFGGKASRQSCTITELTTEDSSCNEWNLVHVHNSVNSSHLTPEAIPAPNANEVHHATDSVMALLQSLSDGSYHSWPDADASVVASEQAMAAAAQVVHLSPGDAINEMSLSSDSPLGAAARLVHNNPSEARAVVESLVLDPNVWTAVSSNASLRSFLERSSVLRIKDQEVTERTLTGPDTMDAPSLTQDAENVADTENGNSRSDKELSFMDLVVSAMKALTTSVSQLCGTLFGFASPPPPSQQAADDVKDEKMKSDEEPDDSAAEMLGAAVSGFVLLAVIVIGMVLMKRSVI